MVNQQRTEWANQTHNSASRHTGHLPHLPRRAGVSSFGMGGTNAHAILEEAPERCGSPDSRPWQLLMLSAKTPTALVASTQNLITYLKQHLDQPLADIAYTLQIGRRPWPYRRFCLCQTVEDALSQLSQQQKDSVQDIASTSTAEKSIVFMFSGQGSQHRDMARGLYETEPTFQKAIDQCADILQEQGIDLQKILYLAGEADEPPNLRDTAQAQIALFTVEYALAMLWMSWGVQPKALIGHSIGEYVAACIAGVFSLTDALYLVAQRGQLMQGCQPGSMLSVVAAAETIQTYLPANAEIAVINSSKNCVVSGPTPVIESLQKQLEEKSISCRLLVTSHAFHSAMMEPALDDFSKAFQKVTLLTPQVNFISNVTGTWISDADATDPNYWVRHLRSTVRFSQGITEVFTLPNLILLEVGPSHTLTRLAQQQLSQHDLSHVQVIQSLPHPKEAKSDTATLMTTLGKLWLGGIPIDWAKFYAGRNRHRLSLPTYPFERKSYWVTLRAEQESGEAERTELENLSKSTTAKSSAKVKAADMADWFYLPSWKRLPLTATTTAITTAITTMQSDRTAHHGWLVFCR